MDDPGDMLEYLKTRLADAETNLKKVWIIGNIPPGSPNCNNKWARRYNAIVERYQSIIKMQLFGHESEAFWQLQYPESGVRNPFGVTIQGGKMSSLKQNPKFKVLTID